MKELSSIIDKKNVNVNCPLEDVNVNAIIDNSLVEVTV